MTTSRERVLTSLNHKTPDRIPVDFSGHRSSGIAAEVYPKLRRLLGLPEKTVRIYDIIQQLAIVDEDVLDVLGGDTIEMGRGFLLSDEDWKDWSQSEGISYQIPSYIQTEQKGKNWSLLSYEGKELGIKKQGWLYFEQTFYPLLEQGIENIDFSDLEKIIEYTMWSGIQPPGAHLPLNDKGLEEITEKAKALYESTDRAVIGLFGGSMFELPQWLFRMDNYLLYLHMYPEAVDHLSEKLCDIHLHNLEKWLKAVGPYIDIIAFGDDLGGQNSPLISRDMYRRYFKPYHRKLWTRARKLADVKVMLHCCGETRELIPDLIEAGLDAVNPVQISCKYMDASVLKKEFGDKLTFWGGGCDTRDILPNAQPDAVKKHVADQVNIFSPGGGFVFQQVHNILADVPPENITAMFEAVKAK